MTTASTIITNPDFNRANSVYEFTVKTIRGNKCELHKYRGFVCLIVNVATKSKIAAESFKLLNQLHEDFSERGLRILAFPCNQFGLEEPGTSEETLAFVTERGVQFEVFEKIDVNGNEASPLWKYLKYMVGNGGQKGGVVTTNFTKFLTNKLGIPQERLGPEATLQALSHAVEMYL